MNNYNMHSQVTQLLRQNTSEQRTPEWFAERHKILSASDVASSLEANPYLTKLELLKKKSKPWKESIGSSATEWGVKYEPVAIKIYEDIVKDKVLEFGLMHHPTISWLSSPP